MLSGARNYRDSILSQKLYNRIQSLFPDQKENLIAASILLCNTYSAVGEYEQAKAIRSNRIKQLGKNVKAGLSWTEYNGKLAVKKIFFILLNVKTYLFSSNSRPTIILILNQQKFLLKLKVGRMNSSNMVTNTIQAGSLVHYAKMKQLNLYYVAIVNALQLHSI